MRSAYVCDMSKENLINQLGALALAIVDKQFEAGLQAGGTSASAAALVSVLGLHPDETISDMAAVIGLSHSATVRVVDRLEEKGLVARRVGGDRREIRLRLTRKGNALRRRFLDKRSHAIAQAVDRLSVDEAVEAERLIAKMLVALPESVVHGDRICRFCDEEACGECPVEQMSVRDA